MAAYPTLGVTESSRQTWEDGRVAVRATNGVLKLRRLFASEKSTFELEHELSSASWSTLSSHYTAHRDLAFDYVWPADGVTYTNCKYLSRPVARLQPGGWYMVSVKLGQE